MATRIDTSASYCVQLFFAEMSQVCPLPVLPAKNPNSADFQFFLRQFDNYLVNAKVEREARLPLLLNALARNGIALFDGLREPKATFDEGRERLTEYFSGKSSVLL